MQDPNTEMMRNQKMFWKSFTTYFFLTGSSVALPSTPGHGKQKYYPPIKDDHRPKRSVPLPKTSKITGKPDVKYSAGTFFCCLFSKIVALFTRQ